MDTNIVDVHNRELKQPPPREPHTDHIGDEATTITRRRGSRVGTPLLGPHCFAAVVCFYIVSFVTTEMYVVAVLTTVERRFGFRSSSSGMLLSGKEVAYVCLVAVASHYGNRLHRPRLLAAAAILGAFGNALSAMPHFLYDSSPAANGSQPGSAAAAAAVVNSLSRLCRPNVGMNNVSHTQELPGLSSSNVTGCVDNDAATSDNVGAYVIFMVSNVIIGFAIAPMVALTTTYVDDAVGPVRNAMYLGEMVFLFGFPSWRYALLNSHALCLLCVFCVDFTLCAVCSLCILCILRTWCTCVLCSLVRSVLSVLGVLCVFGEGTLVYCVHWYIVFFLYSAYFVYLV